METEISKASTNQERENVKMWYQRLFQIEMPWMNFPDTISKEKQSFFPRKKKTVKECVEQRTQKKEPLEQTNHNESFVSTVLISWCNLSLDIICKIQCRHRLSLMIATPGQDCLNNDSLETLNSESTCENTEADIIYLMQYSISDIKKVDRIFDQRIHPQIMQIKTNDWSSLEWAIC